MLLFCRTLYDFDKGQSSACGIAGGGARSKTRNVIGRAGLICGRNCAVAMEDVRLALIGCGVMGGGMVRAMLAAKVLAPSQVWATVATCEKLDVVSERLGTEVRCGHDNTEAVRWANTVLLSVKPNMLGTAMEQIGLVLLKDRLVLSIVANKSISYFEQHNISRVVRVMPNLPCSVGQGAVSVAIGGGAAEDRVTIMSLLQPLGYVVELPEEQMGAAMAIAGCGPAFASLFADALADGGVLLGLPRPIALDLALHTMRGTCAMLLESSPRMHPAVFRDAVATPGGTTIRGLAALEQRGVRYGVSRAVVAATRAGSEDSQPDGSSGPCLCCEKDK